MEVVHPSLQSNTVPMMFIQYNYLLNIIILNTLSNMISIAHKILPQESDTQSIILDNLFPNETHINDDSSSLQVFESTSLEDHLHLLKRIHLNIPHLPSLNLVGDFHKNIEINMPIYSHTLLQQIHKYTHQQKIDILIQLLSTYQTLIKQYGYFIITHRHIRVDQQSRLALWINQDFTKHQCSHPLQYSIQNAQAFALNQFIKLVKTFFKADIFKNRNIGSFAQLANYLDFIKKRNRIHKKCSNIVRQISQQKRRATLSVKNNKSNCSPQKRHDRYLRPISSFCALGVSKIMSRSREKDSLLNISISRIQVSRGSDQQKKMKSQVDTTIVSTELKNTRNISYLQLSNIIQRSQKKSCVFGSNPHPIQENFIKHSSVLNRENLQNNTKINRKFCPIQYKRQRLLKKQPQIQIPQRRSFIDKKNSLQIGLNSLLLSQINEDPQNETAGSDLKKRQHLKEVIEQFESLLCN